MGSDERIEMMSRDKQLRRLIHWLRGHCRRRHSLWTSAVIGVVVVLTAFGGTMMALWSFRHFQCYTREAGIHWQPAPIVNIPRPCPPVNYTTIVTQPQQLQESSPHICLTTLTDRQSTSAWQRMLRCRDFDGVANLTFGNLKAYADRHGYTFVDASALIDTRRPPAWSKILAVQSLLQAPQKTTTILDNDSKVPLCDWVFWIDADIVVMNSSIRIESFLPTPETGIDLLVTTDRRLTANSGAWLIRNTKWSRSFLNKWWNMPTWVRQPGLSLSGDNAAFGHLMQKELSMTTTTTTRVHMVPRCTFNSFAVFVPEGSSDATTPKSIISNAEWYMSENFYHQGDFMAHASGVDQKQACVEMLLTKAT